MAKAKRTAESNSPTTKSRKTVAKKTSPRAAAVKAAPARVGAEPARSGWATDLVFDVREPKLAVSLRLDADVLRYFRDLGAGYQTRINEVLKAFMQARGGSEAVSHPTAGARTSRSASGNGKRAAR
jgi:uncharacterized protein (DUF4415 family)